MMTFSNRFIKFEENKKYELQLVNFFFCSLTFFYFVTCIDPGFPLKKSKFIKQKVFHFTVIVIRFCIYRFLIIKFCLNN